MNISKELQKEHSLIQARKIATYACATPARFAALMSCFLHAEYRLSQRAAWSVSYAARQKPELVKPYLKTLTDQLSRTDVHDAVIRNALRILQDMDLPEPLHGPVMTACFGFIQDAATPVAFKAFSLTVLDNLSHTYPDIKKELKLIIQERWQQETPAFRSRAKKIMKG